MHVSQLQFPILLRVYGKIIKIQFTTSYSKTGITVTGGVMIAKTYMETTDTAFFSVQTAGNTQTTAGNLLTHHESHWCSVRLIDY